MAAARKYAGLPDLDLAPDIYETPDLADDVSTLQANSIRSPSSNSAYDDSVPNEDSEDTSGIVRQHLRPAEARTRFGPARVDARNVDFSETLNGAKRYYKTSTQRRRRKSYDGEDDQYGDFSDEEDESIDRKLARLKRELEEVKLELEESDLQKRNQRKQLSTDKVEADDSDVIENVRKLSGALDAIYTTRHGTSKGAEDDLAKTIAKFDKASMTSRSQSQSQHRTANQLPATSLEHQTQLIQAFSNSAELDARLDSLERSLGLSGANLPESNIGSNRPIIPTLDMLDRQFQIVCNSATTIEAAQSKARRLIDDAERLQKLKEDGQSSPPSSAGLPPSTRPSLSYSEDPERASKINALHGTLSTIDSLAPTLPVVLDRLRTLHFLHTSAASASATLDDMEKRQSEQKAEIQQWHEALNNVEKNLNIGESGLSENIKNITGWIKELEARMATFD
ncbi:putative dynactin subunit 2 protein [Venturia nashicola]|uniref:Putative dynactin subunit 2 protein n=1 Tax=Venturia nashicola TaxID=86259 RepID=A0A4Z1NMI7_9PEZI|nr:putative dynactin subunit 2 protein [Venturia nashicola]